MLRTYLLISNIDRASLTRPFPHFRTQGLIVRSCYLLTLYVHNRLCHQPTHLLHAYVKSLFAFCKYLIHLIHYPLPPASFLNPPSCFLPLPCGNFHLWLLSFLFCLTVDYATGEPLFQISTKYSISSCIMINIAGCDHGSEGVCGVGGPTI